MTEDGLLEHSTLSQTGDSKGTGGIDWVRGTKGV